MRFRRPLIVLATATFMLGASLSGGCASQQVSLALKDSEAGANASTYSYEELSAAEQAILAESVVGEIQSVYESGTGLMRVYGQAANLSDEPFMSIRFDVVIEVGDGDSVSQERVATFTVDDLQPGGLKPFDVQTPIPTGSAKNLKVIPVAVAR